MSSDPTDTPDLQVRGVGVPEATRHRSPLRRLGSATLLLVGAVAVALVVKSFVAQAFFVPSSSMEPTLEVGDRLVVERWGSWTGEEITRGDVVVFSDPGGWLEGADEQDAGVLVGLLRAVGLASEDDHLVKRVVGVAGDVVHCCDDRGRLEVNGVAVDETQYALVDDAECYGPMTGTCDWTAGPVPDGMLFVMGDHRSASADSSVRMCSDAVTDCVEGHEWVPVDDVVGRVLGVAWPASRFGGLDGADVLAAVPAAHESAQDSADGTAGAGEGR
ncbi:signal peptidase I [Nocardioides bruguierae]|uniref:signal peptidase I n=1 Tax=Nocardioides bruguierae TaxID=2945102 RepID=UPI002021D293|nr:signal peptidase I [Nocardioides bruguierae]MCL8026619.1 signal peptidase I [Nocardioides bruguierae]